MALNAGMYLPRTQTLWTAGITAVAIFFGTIFRFEIEQAWVGGIRPWLEIHAAPGMMAVADFLWGFPGGVLFALSVFFIVDQVVSWQARSAPVPLSKKIDVAPTSYRLSNLAAAVGLVSSSPSETARVDDSVGHDEHDLVAGRFLLRGTRSDDGIDIHAIIQFRNRSRHTLQVGSISARFELDGKVGKGSSGITTPIAAEKSQSLRFNPMRIYSEKDPQGVAEFKVKFGPTKDEMLTILSMRYDFTVRSYPKSKSVDAVLEAEVKPHIEYTKIQD